MKAVILVGGFGTRLRPFTFEKPKPLIPFVDKPIIEHQISALSKVGVKVIILAVGFKSDVLTEYAKITSKKYNVEIIISKEDVPLGTAGPLALTKKILEKDTEPFFMFNSDVICNYPLNDLLKFHKNHGGEGSILVTKVEDPSKYGVVVSKDDGQIEKFVEKPKVFVSDRINAGLYLLSVDILKRIKLEKTSIERKIFPQIVLDEKLYAMDLPGYWMDIGQPPDYLVGMKHHLASLKDEEEKNGASLTTKVEGATINGNVYIDKTAKIGNGVTLGPNVTIGPNCVIEDDTKIENSALFSGVLAKSSSSIKGSIIGWKTVIGSKSSINKSYIGEDVNVADGTQLDGTWVCPHKSVKPDTQPKKVIL